MKKERNELILFFGCIEIVIKYTTKNGTLDWKMVNGRIRVIETSVGSFHLI